MPSFVVSPSTTIEGTFTEAGRKSVTKIDDGGHFLSVGEKSDISGLKIEILGKKNRLIVGPNCRLRGHILIKGNNHTVNIGAHTTFTNAYLLCNGGDITIGKWCMLSRQIEIRTTDAHSLIDVATGKRINQNGSIKIGDHVWISLGVVINKGVEIASDNVIGAGAFVNRSFLGTQCVLAGRPAKVVRQGVTWNRGQKDHFSQEEMYHWHSDIDPI